MGIFATSGLAAFRYRQYQLFWVAAAFSNIGMWSLIFASLWLMHGLTDSPLMVGLVTTSSLGPVLVFSVWGGVVADQVNRLRLVRATRALFSILSLLTGFLVATNVIQPWHLLAISVASGILLAFDTDHRRCTRRDHSRRHPDRAVPGHARVCFAGAIAQRSGTD